MPARGRRASKSGHGEEATAKHGAEGGAEGEGRPDDRRDGVAFDADDLPGNAARHRPHGAEFPDQPAARHIGRPVGCQGNDHRRGSRIAAAVSRRRVRGEGAAGEVRRRHRSRRCFPDQRSLPRRTLLPPARLGVLPPDLLQGRTAVLHHGEGAPAGHRRLLSRGLFPERLRHPCRRRHHSADQGHQKGPGAHRRARTGLEQRAFPQGGADRQLRHAGGLQAQRRADGRAAGQIRKETRCMDCVHR